MTKILDYILIEDLRKALATVGCDCAEAVMREAEGLAQQRVIEDRQASLAQQRRKLLIKALSDNCANYLETMGATRGKIDDEYGSAVEKVRKTYRKKIAELARVMSGEMEAGPSRKMIVSPTQQERYMKSVKAKFDAGHFEAKADYSDQMAKLKAERAKEMANIQALIDEAKTTTSAKIGALVTGDADYVNQQFEEYKNKFHKIL